MIVLDTSALIFWTLFPERLTAKAIEAIQKAEIIQISSISIWEIGIKVNKGHLLLSGPLSDYVAHLEQTLAVQIMPVDVETWLENLNLDWKHQDPADRTIVAYARLLNCPLISSDGKIAAFYPETIW
jgi:PIN domain nuclease of toxin-antitoxin system